MKKGFTLVELLATVIILGLILLITVPRIAEIIDNSTKSTEASSAQNYVEALDKSLINGLKGYPKTGDYTISVEDLKDWAKNNVSGELPQSGTIKVKDRSVDSATFQMENYKVVCNKSECHAVDDEDNGEYVYYQQEYTMTGPNDFPTITYEDTTPTPDLSKKVYLKYPVTGTTLGAPQACLNDGTEFCLDPNEYETSKQKILNYFEYDANTWTQNETISAIWAKDDKYCNIDYSTSSGIALSCHVSSVYMGARADGLVDVGVLSTRFHCGVFGDGRAVCRVD